MYTTPQHQRIQARHPPAAHLAPPPRRLQDHCCRTQPQEGAARPLAPVARLQEGGKASTLRQQLPHCPATVGRLQHCGCCRQLRLLLPHGMAAPRGLHRCGCRALLQEAAGHSGVAAELAHSVKDQGCTQIACLAIRWMLAAAMSSSQGHHEDSMNKALPGCPSSLGE